MSAFARTRELQKVESLLQIGKDEVYGEAMTLQHPRLMELLDRIDAAMLDAHTSSATSTPEALKMAADHAHKVYRCCAQRTPLAQHRWEKWSRMLSVCLTHARDMASDDVCQHIASLAAQLHAYRRKEWWGSAAEVRRELHLLQQELQNDDEACTGTTHDGPYTATTTTHATATTTTAATSSQPRWRSAEDVAAAHAPLLHRFSRLCFDGRHLFGVYGDVGRIQRESFLEGVLMRGGLEHTTEEAAVEALQRQTFRRDVVVPCDAVAETMWLEYEDFEVDESKKKEMEHLRTCTMKSACYTAMKNFFEYESSHDGVDDGGVVVMDDARGEALADACAAAMRSSRDVGPLPTFAFGMRRVLELERFPAVLNPSRVEYFVGLLHGWAKSYATSQHRWSWQSPFSAETDEDVWCFVLERHEVLLRWALLRPTSSPTPGTPEALEMLRGQILMLRFMAHAVLHMYAHYVAIVDSSKASTEKKRQRLMCVQAATQVWVEEVLGKCFAKCLLSDVYALASSPDDDDDVSVFALEADLKLVLCDVDALLHGSSLAPTIIRHRLLPLTQDSVEMMESLASRTTTPVVATLDACALTNLRLMSWLRRTLSSSASLRTTLSTCADEAGFVGQLVALHRRCFYVVARHGLPASTVDAARDAWMACVQMAQVEVEMGGTCSQRIFCMSVAGNDVLDVVMEERRSRKRARG